MRNSAPRSKGKLKGEIAAEAFAKIGPNATVQQVDEHFRKYGLPFCERSMYGKYKRIANGRPVLPRRQYPRNADQEGKIVAIIERAKQLAADIGGYDELIELIRILR